MLSLVINRLILIFFSLDQAVITIHLMISLSFSISSCDLLLITHIKIALVTTSIMLVNFPGVNSVSQVVEVRFVDVDKI